MSSRGSATQALKSGSLQLLALWADSCGGTGSQEEPDSQRRRDRTARVLLQDCRGHPEAAVVDK
jgi:hypothetical protein